MHGERAVWAGSSFLCRDTSCEARWPMCRAPVCCAILIGVEGFSGPPSPLPSVAPRHRCVLRRAHQLHGCSPGPRWPAPCYPRRTDVSRYPCSHPAVALSLSGAPYLMRRLTSPLIMSLPAPHKKTSRLCLVVVGISFPLLSFLLAFAAAVLSLSAASVCGSSVWGGLVGCLFCWSGLFGVCSGWFRVR